MLGCLATAAQHSNVWNRIGTNQFVPDVNTYTGYTGFTPSVPRCP